MLKKLSVGVITVFNDQELRKIIMCVTTHDHVTCLPFFLSNRYILLVDLKET